jgi:hypothetical protein
VESRRTQFQFSKFTGIHYDYGTKNTSNSYQWNVPSKKYICPENADSDLIYSKTVAQANGHRMDHAGML